MNKKLVTLIIAGLLLVSVSALYFAHFNKSNISVLKNCRDLGGYLCSGEGQCASTWLKSTESYCCPIKCGSCSQEVLANCSSNNQCVKAECSQKTSLKCEFKNITPCANNGRCEHGEIETCDYESGYEDTPEGKITGPALCCSGTSHAVISKKIESNDCPESCDDGYDNTADYYDFIDQKCGHYSCSRF